MIARLLRQWAASLAYGCADFLGGLGARKRGPTSCARHRDDRRPGLAHRRVAAARPLLGASFAPATLAWGAASGVASAAAFALLYRTLAIGLMNVLSPVTALVSAMLPVGVGLLQGEHLGLAGLIGLPLALVAVVLVSAAWPGSERPSRTALLLASAPGLPSPCS